MTELQQVAELIRKRNEIGKQITQIIGRPSQIGHLGEFIASRTFDIELESSAVCKGYDGRFRRGPLAGKCVNVKWYAKREGLLDIRLNAIPDYYLVLTGPLSRVMHSRGDDRPWLIESVYLFEGVPLLATLQGNGTKICEATSVVKQLWLAAEIFPSATNPALPLIPQEVAMLTLFGSSAVIT